jgi:hypothetical protein
MTVYCCEPDCFKPVSGKGSAFCDYHQGKIDRVKAVFARIKDSTPKPASVKKARKGKA